MNFEWDDNKNTTNQKNHSISFEEAILAFKDSNRIILEDKMHSDSERRLFCIGNTKMPMYALLVRGVGGKVNKFTRNKTKYSETPAEFKDSLGKAVQIDDFLAPPEQLFSQEPMKKITIELSSSSVEYFKILAQEFQIPYQQMIRKVLDSYVRKYSAQKIHRS